MVAKYSLNVRVCARMWNVCMYDSNPIGRNNETTIHIITMRTKKKQQERKIPNNYMYNNNYNNK